MLDSHPLLKFNAYLVLAQMVWALSATFTRAALTASAFPPLMWAVGRTLIAVSCLKAIVVANGDEARYKPLTSAKDERLLVVLGLLGVAGNLGFVSYGLAWTSATVTAAFQTTIPPFATLFALVLGVDKLTAFNGTAVVLAVVGDCIMVGVWNIATGAATAHYEIGCLCLLVNCACFGMYLVLQKPLLARLPPLYVLYRVYCYGTLGLLAASLLQWRDYAAFFTAPPIAYAALVNAGVMASVAAFLCMSRALHLGSPIIASLYITLQPLIAGLAAHVALGEVVTARTVVGGGIVAGSVFIGVYGQYRARQAQQQHAEATKHSSDPNAVQLGVLISVASEPDDPTGRCGLSSLEGGAISTECLTASPSCSSLGTDDNSTRTNQDSPTPPPPCCVSEEASRHPDIHEPLPPISIPILPNPIACGAPPDARDE